MEQEEFKIKGNRTLPNVKINAIRGTEREKEVINISFPKPTQHNFLFE